jgi:hypothetical protein
VLTQYRLLKFISINVEYCPTVCCDFTHLATVYTRYSIPPPPSSQAQNRHLCTA